jgi:ribosomal protein S18 acetylase RimI-like enzyme
MAPTRIKTLLLLLPTLVSTSTAFVVTEPEPSLRCSRIPTKLLSANFPFFQDSATKHDERAKPSEHAVPYIIERLPVRPNDKVFDDIADMCIEVFFNDNGSQAPWKSLQLAYLRSLQSSDLRRRHTRGDQQNCMVVARRVIPMNSPLAPPNTPLILDVSQVHNLDDRQHQEDWVRGGILGFCEVTELYFGIADGKESPGILDFRPVLTNLSVRADSRELGIGGKLVDACEDAVLEWKNQNKVILEVESDNAKALEFYKRRGYKILFEDPACRRYNTNGIVLAKEACTKICMRKDLTGKTARKEGEAVKKQYSYDLAKILQSIRDAVFG